MTDCSEVSRKPRKTIFLVDDEVTSLTVGKNILAGLYNVFTLSSGALLFKMLEKSTPDLILLDIHMPEMNGFEVIRLLKNNKETERIPVIFLTAKADQESELEAFSCGALDFIKKPFSPLLLLKHIEIHLLLHSQRSDLEKSVEEKINTVLELQNIILETMVDLIEQRGSLSGGHVERTQGFLGILLEALMQNDRYKDEISSWDKKLVLQSAQLHDVGKIAINDSLLLKPEKLSEEEFEQIKEHEVFGEQIIARIRERATDHAFLEYAKIFAATHHEKWDGTGYPKGLKGEEIPLLGRLMSIVDIYDSVVSEKPYKKALLHEDAVKVIIDGKDIHFDPDLVDIFVSVSGEFKKITDNWLKK